MKRKLLALVIPWLFFLNQPIKAQVSTYSFSQALIVYTASPNGTFVGTQLQDDVMTPVTLPFPFNFNGTTYTTVNVFSNGFLSFSVSPATELIPLSDNGSQEIISAFGQDLYMGTIISASITPGSNILANCSSVNGYSVGDVLKDYNTSFGGINPTITSIGSNAIFVNVPATSINPFYDVANLNGHINYYVSGTAPNRVCEFEYVNFTRYGVYDEVINFKILLYETSFKIEIQYGKTIPGNEVKASQVGLKSKNYSDFNSRKVNLQNPWQASIPATLITDDCVFSYSLTPSFGFGFYGTSYLWTPPPCTIQPLNIMANDTSICLGNSITLAASGANSYTWSNGATGSVIVVSPTNTDIYSVTSGIATCLITRTVQVEVYGCTGISELNENSNGIGIFPNPVKSVLHVNNPHSQELKIRISDYLGKVVLETRSQQELITLNTTMLEPGFYLVNISSRNYNVAYKLLKE